MTREPDRYEEKAAEVLRDVMDAERRGDNMDPIIAAALAAAESSALERAADIADSYGCDYAARSIRALASPAAAPAAEKVTPELLAAHAADLAAGRHDLNGAYGCSICGTSPSEPAAPAPSAAEKRIAELEAALRELSRRASDPDLYRRIGASWLMLEGAVKEADAILAARAAPPSTPGDGGAET